MSRCLLVAVAVLAASACEEPEQSYFEEGADKSDSAASSRYRASDSVLETGDQQEVDYTGAGDWTGDCGPGLTTGTQALLDYLEDRYPQIESIGGFSCRHIVGNSSKASVHSTGRALDIMLPLGFRNDADNGKGDPIADFLIANAEDIGVQYFIWDRTSWGAHRTVGNKERPYRGQHPHNDHLHVELSVEASLGQTAWLEPDWEPLEVEGPEAPPPEIPEPPQSEPVPVEDLPEEPSEDPPEEEAPQDPGKREFPPEAPAPTGSCDPLPAIGGVIDTGSNCLWLRGSTEFWNFEDTGYDGELAWTTAVQSGAQLTSAEWTIVTSEEGDYDLEVYIEPDFSQHDRVRYELQHGRTTTALVADLSKASGWHSLGVFAFGEGTQKLTLFDNNDEGVEAQTRIVVDAIRLHNTASSEPPPEDKGRPPATPTPTEPDSEQDEVNMPDGKLVSGCQVGAGGASSTTLVLLLLLLGLFRRSRKGRASV